MKDEYGAILIGFILILCFYAIVFLVADLFVDDIFGLGMILTLIVFGIMFGIFFIVQVFKTNYQIKKRD